MLKLIHRRSGERRVRISLKQNTCIVNDLPGCSYQNNDHHKERNKTKYNCKNYNV